MGRLHVEYLNHASLLVHAAGVRLLFDPWFEGTAFSGGWQLAYDNPEAWDRAARATHLWISHWHSDHLHPPTLRKLAARNPEIEVLANVSPNFSMVDRIKALGFRRVRPLAERVPLRVGELVLERFPTTTIDNMLVVRAGDLTLLNYNDCNLPGRALRMLVNEIGSIDLLLTNYNHAGKLFDARTPEAIVRDQLDVLRRTVDIIAPRRVIPFASAHAYRVPATLSQNESLIDFDALNDATDERFVVLRVGDAVTFDEALEGTITPGTRPTRSPVTPLRHESSVPFDEALDVAARYVRRVRNAFLGTTLLLPTLRVRLDDLHRVIALDFRRGAREAAEPAHIALHSRGLVDWMDRPFGEDTLLAGAHFEVLEEGAKTTRLVLLATTLFGNHAAPRDLIRLLGSGFFRHRREEIWATLTGMRFRAGEMRL